MCLSSGPRPIRIPSLPSRKKMPQLAARGCGAPCLSRSSSTSLTSPAPHQSSSKPRPPRRSSASALLHPHIRGKGGSLRADLLLPQFDKRQPLLWRAFFLQLAMRFCSASACQSPMCEYYGDLVGDQSFSPRAFARFRLLGNGTCPLALEGGFFYLFLFCVISFNS